MARPSPTDVVKMLANFASQVTSLHTYDARTDTRVENVSSCAVTSSRISASDSRSFSGVTPRNGLSAVMGCTTVQCSGKNGTVCRSSASVWMLRSRDPSKSSYHDRLTVMCTSVSSLGSSLTNRNISPRPPSYGAMTIDSLKRRRARGRVRRAMISPAATNAIIGPSSDSATTSTWAVLPTACMLPVPDVVKTPTLNTNARRNGSSSPSASVPAIACGPSAR